VKRQLSIRPVGCFFSLLSCSDVSDDCDAAGDAVVFVAQ
jgi:hypothetical protein